jgi:uncharacterized protein GlcG (DUF336 family)
MSMTVRAGYGVCLATLLPATLLLSACSGGSGVASSIGADPTPASCSGTCSAATSKLSVADVQKVLAQGIAEARAQSRDATIAVVDRVGNVLAVYRMGTAATRRVLIATALDASGNPVVRSGLEGIRLPVTGVALNIDDQAAIAKAVTGAYLSSEGNAFSTRTASQIVQQHFNPGEDFQPGGPLFGVQFSQLACSDFTRAFDGPQAGAGPQRSPLGRSADPGGFPLYKDGTVVGGVGVIADGQYGIDARIDDKDINADELIAWAASSGFAAPVERRADQITVDGKTLRFSDVGASDLKSDPATAPAFTSLPATIGTLLAVKGYGTATIRAGTAFGQTESGIRADGGVSFPGQDAFVFVTAADALRYPPRAGTDAAGTGGASLTQTEVLQLLRSGLDVANRARAQIRLPLGSQARVTISVVDTQGEVLGMVRTRDAPVFGADVSLQKARSAAFFSSASARSFLASLPDARYVATSDAGGVDAARTVRLVDYATALQSFVADPAALTNGQLAYSDRAIGNLARPFFPDGITGNDAGPLSKPAGQWSVFSSGLQLDLSINAILQHVLYVAGLAPADVGAGCAGVALDAGLAATRVVSGLRLGNGAQIFPGSVPLYRGNTLIGAIGVSGDGIDQDDMVSFLGASNAAAVLNTQAGNAPAAKRSDTLAPRGIRLRYVQCPQAPFLDSSDQNVCDGK